MKTVKRIGYILIIVLMSVILFSASVSAGTSKSGINIKKATIYVGKSIRLSVKTSGKITWKSSRPKVASVSTKGKVTAKKTGVSVITAKVGKTKYTCKITVKNKASKKTGTTQTASTTTATASKTTEATSTAKTTSGTDRQTYVIDGITSGMTSREVSVYHKLTAMTRYYPEGKRFDSTNWYRWNGGVFSGGFGCSAFAFLMSDAAFGSAPARRHTDFGKIRVGDIIRMEYNSHSVIVMKVVGDTIVIAEGNYGGTVHWGRLITRSDVRRTGTYVMTRYAD